MSLGRLTVHSDIYTRERLFLEATKEKPRKSTDPVAIWQELDEGPRVAVDVVIVGGRWLAKHYPRAWAIFVLNGSRMHGFIIDPEDAPAKNV